MKHSFRVRLFAVALALAVPLGFSGCGQSPTETTRQNRRLTDALLTAVTTKNVKELDKAKSLIDKRRTDELLSEAHHKKLTALHAQAKSGQWGEAEDGLYKFRESEPFPK
jgi:hypothetical protein